MDMRAHWGSPRGGSRHAGKRREWTFVLRPGQSQLSGGPWGEGPGDPRDMNPGDNPQIVPDSHFYLSSFGHRVLLSLPERHHGIVRREITGQKVGLRLGGVAQWGLQSNQTELYSWFCHFTSHMNLGIFQVLRLPSVG